MVSGFAGEADGVWRHDLNVGGLGASMGTDDLIGAEADAVAAVQYLASRSGYRLTVDDEPVLVIQAHELELN